MGDVNPLTKNLRTPRGRLSYPTLFEPKAQQAGGEAKFSCTIIFDAAAQATPEFAALKKAAGAAAQEKWGAKLQDPNFARSIKTPFHDSATHPTASGKPGYENGTKFIRTSAKEKPFVVDKAIKPIIDRSEIYAGCYVVANVNAFAYETNGNRGVSFGINGVQKVGEGDPLGSRGRPEDMFEPIADAPGETPAAGGSEPAGSLFG